VNIKTKAALAAATIAFAPAALAQTAAPSAASPPAAAASGTAASTSFSDDDLKKFASAAIEINKIQSDTATPDTDKQPKMLAAVQKSGLPPEKFNQIAEAAQTDTALQQKIQAAAGASAQPAAPSGQTPQ